MTVPFLAMYEAKDFKVEDERQRLIEIVRIR